MKFVCERCNTRYTIADEKVRNKVLKIRCKACENIITVREGSQPGFVAGAAASRSAGVAAEWWLSVEGKEAGPFTPVDLAKRIAEAQPGEDLNVWRDGFDAWKPIKDVPGLMDQVAALRAAGSTPPPVKPPPRPAAPPAPPAEALRPSRPHAAVAVAARATRSVPTAPGAHGLVLPAPALVREVALDAAAGSATPRPVAAASALADVPARGRLRMTPPPEVLATPIPMALTPGPRLPTPNGVLPLPSVTPTPAFGLFGTPALGAPVAAAGAPVAPGRTPAPAPFFPPGPGSAVGLRPGSGLSQVRGLPGFFAKYPGIKYAAAGSIVTALLIAVVLVSVRRPPERAAPAAPAPAPGRSAAAEEAERLAREQAEQRFRDMVPPPQPPAPAVPTAVDFRAGAPRRSPGAKPPRPAGNRPPVAPPPVANPTAEQEAASRRFAQNQGERRVTALAPSAAAPGAAEPKRQVSEGEIRGVVLRRDNQASLKSCYDRALKRDERLRHGRLDVSVSIAATGMVRSVKVNAPPDFTAVEPCIAMAIKRWTFPPSAEAYDTAFPLILQAGQ